MIQKSSIFKALIYFFAFISICPQKTTQQLIQNGTCVYSFDSSTGLYSCKLTITVTNPTDILSITGTHMQGKTDNDVKMVKYSGNTMYYLNGDILKKFENLINLRLDTVLLRQINEDAFEYCPNLEEYVSGISDLVTYPPQMMKNCQKLKIFRAYAQEYFEIPEIFGNITSLEEVRISDNHLTSLPENFIKNKPNLRIFNVKNNQLMDLAPNFFENCPNLEEVDVSRNNFEDQSKLTRAFNGNTNLKKLLINLNGFDNFDFTFLSQFNKLETLAVGRSFGAKLTQISWQSLPSSLTDLYVQSIGEEIGENSFNHLVKLESLSIFGSGITNLHKDTFKYQTELKSLQIQNTNLTTLNPELFTNQANLLDLRINNNKIEALPTGIFAQLVNLGKDNSMNGLSLSNNKIKRLNVDSFGQHPNLRFLDFSYNEIDAIERDIFSRFSAYMYQANFNSNICINKMFSDQNNIHEDESLQWCFDSWEGITTTTTTTTSTTTTFVPPTTTPGGAGNNFKKFEVFVIIFIGFVGVLRNFVK